LTTAVFAPLAKKFERFLAIDDFDLATLYLIVAAVQTSANLSEFGEIAGHRVLDQFIGCAARLGRDHGEHRTGPGARRLLS